MNIIQSKEGWYGIEEDTHVFKWIQETGKLDHDEFLIPIAVENIPVGGIVFDCGALYGDHTIQYARKVGPEGCVIAIEANPLAFECLKLNAVRFQGPTISMNLALGESHGGTAVHIMDSCNIGASTVLNGSSTEESPQKLEKEIRTATIDGIVHDANLENVHFIKIDCEGHELKILKGAELTLKRLKPKLLIEMNSFALSLQGACYKDIYDFLLGQNYSWRIVQPDCKGGDQMYDVMAWPNVIEPLKLLKAEKIIPVPTQ